MRFGGSLSTLMLMLVIGASAAACSNGSSVGSGYLDGEGGSGNSVGSDGSTGTDASGTGGTGGTGVGGSSGDFDAGADPDACAGVGADVTPSATLLYFVVDASASMLWDVTNQEPDMGEPTKWDLAKTALGRAVRAMPETIALGMSFFPNSTSTEPCIVNEVAVLLDWLTPGHKASVEAALAQQAPAGGTPTHDAWAFGVETIAASSLISRKFIVLITDGAPTWSLGCTAPPDAPQLFADAAAALGNRSIGTFVLGTPGSQGGGTGPNVQPDARPTLSMLAEAGGTAPRDAAGSLACTHTGPNYCHFDMTRAPDFSRALADALDKITTTVIDTTLDLPPPPPGQQVDFDTLEVLYVPQADSGTEGAGVDRRPVQRSDVHRRLVLHRRHAERDRLLRPLAPTDLEAPPQGEVHRPLRLRRPSCGAVTGRAGLASWGSRRSCCCHRSFGGGIAKPRFPC